jgi:hypothetical protein
VKPPERPWWSRGFAQLQDRAEEWIYRLNEREHWIFRLYDAFNEAWAALVFRGLRRRAGRLDRPIRARGGLDARVRFLHPEDEGAFAQLLGKFDFRYLPPHGLDPAAARRALRRRSYLPFGIFVEERLVGYLLLRLFFPRRAVTGIWTLPETYNLGLGQESLRQTAAFTTAERMADYATIPVDNPNSVRMATAAGWRVIRTNRRFHVLLHQ